MSNVYIQSRHHMDLLRHAFQYLTAPRFDEHLSTAIQQVRDYQSGTRQGFYDHIEGYPCGMQDAFGDKVDSLYFRFNALKIAYKLKRGDATKAKQVFDSMIGAI